MEIKNISKKGYIAGMVSILVNIFLFGIKYWAGIVSGSVALLADAWHTLSDSLTSIIVIVGIKLSLKKPDKRHPYGYGRWEQIATIFIGFVLALVAYGFIREAYERFNNHTAAHYGAIAITVTVLSIVVKEGLAQYAFLIYRRTRLESVKADAWHHRSDSFSSLIILVGIFLKGTFWWIDSLLAVIVSIMLFYAVYGIFKSGITSLLGEEPSVELISKVKEIAARTVNMDLYLHHFHIHHYGPHKELTFHIKIPEKYETREAHRIATRIEKVILEELNIQATIHAEPLSKQQLY